MDLRSEGHPFWLVRNGLLHTFEPLTTKNLPCEVAFAWAGTFGETKVGLPYIGQVDRLPGVFFTLGFGGNGIIYSILAAELIRDRLCDVTNPYEGLFRFDR